MRCVDYQRHELWCDFDNHPGSLWRWSTTDGCSGAVCEQHLRNVSEWADLLAVIPLDSRGLPISNADYSYADQVAVVLERIWGRP